MATLIKKIHDSLQIHELKKTIEEGNINYVFFPDKIDLNKISSKDDKKDYIVKAIQRGYKITNDSPDYIKKNKRYLKLYIEKLRYKIENKNYSDLYDVPKEVIRNLNTNRDYIIKAIENGYDIFKDQKQYIIMSNANYIKYYIKITKNVEALNRSSVSEEMIKKIAEDNPNLITQYIDYALKNNQDAWFVVKADLKYIIYYINNAKEISNDFLYSVSYEKWEKIKEINPEIISIAIRKCNDLNTLTSDFIKNEYQDAYINKILQNIINNKYNSLWELDDYTINEIIKDPKKIDVIMDAGYYEIFYYTENNVENTKKYLEDILESDKELLNYINEITHKKFKSYSEFIYLNEHLRSLIYDIEQTRAFSHMDEDLREEVFTVEDKLKELLKVTRISGMNLDYAGLLNIYDSLIPKYKSKIYEELVLKEKNVFCIDIATKKSVFDAIKIFGLFEEDKVNVNIRLNKLKEIINKLPTKISKEEYEKIIDENQSQKEFIEKVFKQVTGKKYIKKEGTQLPPALEIYEKYFIEELTDKKYSFLKKLLPDGTLGSELNKYLKATYEEQECEQYELNNLTKEAQEKIRKIIQNTDIEGAITKHSIHRIFSGCMHEYNKEFYDFFTKNIELILNDEINQSSIKEIQQSFETIKNESPTTEPTYAKAIEFISKIKYGQNIDSMFADALNKAGVTSMEAANYYYDLHNKAAKITSTSLPNYNKIYKEIVNGKEMTFRARRLEKKDPLLVLVGEKDYTNCCQTYLSAGSECNKYSAVSKYSGVFVTEALLNGKWSMLTQSWDWVNNEVYCHDNIEGTKLLKNHKEYDEAVFKMYEEHAKSIIEKSEKDIKEYIEENEITNPETIEQLNNQIIKVVTVGDTYNDINVEIRYQNEIKKPKGPIGYNDYRDSKKQLIISGHEAKVDKKYLPNQLSIYKENNIIKTGSMSELSVSEIKQINKILQEDIKEIYKSQDTKIVFAENWVIIYTTNENGITIENIKATNNNLKELSATLRKLKKIYPNITINTQSDLKKYTETIENIKENDEKTR